MQRSGPVNLSGYLTAETGAQAHDAHGQPGRERQLFRLPFRLFIGVDEPRWRRVVQFQDTPGGVARDAACADQDHLTEGRTASGPVQHMSGPLDVR